jgi:hypothetical protein
MKKQELSALHAELVAEAAELLERKNHDYAGEQAVEGDALANFSVSPKLGICTLQQGILVRMSDKFTRIINFSRSGNLQVKDESIRDTVRDLINYAVIYYAATKEPK